MEKVILGSTIIDCIKATLVGFSAGILFALFKLPIPAPPVLAGILGIVGIFVGYLLVLHFRG